MRELKLFALGLLGFLVACLLVVPAIAVLLLILIIGGIREAGQFIIALKDGTV